MFPTLETFYGLVMFAMGFIIGMLSTNSCKKHDVCSKREAKDKSN